MVTERRQLAGASSAPDGFPGASPVRVGQLVESTIRTIIDVACNHRRHAKLLASSACSQVNLGRANVRHREQTLGHHFAQ